MLEAMAFLFQVANLEYYIAASGHSAPRRRLLLGGSRRAGGFGVQSRAVPSRAGVRPGAGLNPVSAPPDPPLPRFRSQLRALPQRGVGERSLLFSGRGRRAPGPLFRAAAPATGPGTAPAGEGPSVPPHPAARTA